MRGSEDFVIDVGALLKQVEAAAPIDAVEVVAAELGRMAGWLGLQRVEVEPRGDLAEALSAETATGLLPELAVVLMGAVRNGASVGFLEPLGSEEATAYWNKHRHPFVWGRRRRHRPRRRPGIAAVPGVR